MNDIALLARESAFDLDKIEIEDINEAVKNLSKAAGEIERLEVENQRLAGSASMADVNEAVLQGAIKQLTRERNRLKVQLANLQDVVTHKAKPLQELIDDYRHNMKGEE